ncbi:Nitroreductase [Aspergillus sclerotiicarbonarius CBS 121057]|uniref:Nitroreductase n=1 Tax=Aspergillus sclerotiicarbonarius (strain CBS 121057 / IBT 28362) TaxID=1448318 RepID=A0A319EAS6_ASPSB|nr:Nitroreductase [Aspergillus sclerotiicarbonarius CBS 121057]
MLSSAFLQAVVGRRSVYQIANRSPISDQEIRHLVSTAILHAPSCFNSQSTRIVLLLKEEHRKFWDNASNILKAKIGEDAFHGPTEQKMKGFRNGYGSILFFEDPEPVQALADKFPAYASNFSIWAEHANAIHQYILWTALSEHGLGASLQHYSPLVDSMVVEQWNVPAKWELKAQLVFGEPTGSAREKECLSVEDRILVYGE